MQPERVFGRHVFGGTKEMVANEDTSLILLVNEASVDTLSLFAFWLSQPWVLLPSLLPDWLDFTQFYIAPTSGEFSIQSRASIDFGERVLGPIVFIIIPVRSAGSLRVSMKPLALFSYWGAYWLWAAVGLAAYLATLLILFHWLALRQTSSRIRDFFSRSLRNHHRPGRERLPPCTVGRAVVDRERKQFTAGCLLALCATNSTCSFYSARAVGKGTLENTLHFHHRNIAGGDSVGGIGVPVKVPGIAPLHFTGNHRVHSGGIRGIAIRTGHEGWYYPWRL